jgi:uncharacterized membrane protein YbaN (DUF454 family)
MKIADLLPPHIRKAIYTVLGTLVALEAVVDVIPDVLEGRALLVLAALGFTLASANTNRG